MNHDTEEMQVKSLENRLLFSALESARIGLCVISEDGTVVTLTSEFARNIGQQGTELLGRNARRILAVPGLSISRFAELIDLNAADLSTQATYIESADMAVLQLQGRTFSDAAQGRFRVLTIVNITDIGVDRTQLTDTRRELDAMASAVVISDLRQPDLPIVYVNKRFEALTGYTAPEVVGRNCRFLQGAARQQAGLVEIREAVAQRRPCHVVLENYRKNGELFKNELFISPVFDSQGEATHYIGLQREAGDRY